MCLSQIDPEADSDLKILYHHIAVRCVCCLAQPDLAIKLAKKWLLLTSAFYQQEYVLIALHRGCAPLFEALLETIDIEELSEVINPFFLLHKIQNHDVPRMVPKLLELGFNINEKRHPLEVEINAIFPDFYAAQIENISLGRGSHVARKMSAHSLHFRDELGGESVTPLRWAIFQNNSALVKALLTGGAEFPKIPDRNVMRQSKSTSPWPEELCTVYVLDQPCYNIEIWQMFLDKHGKQDGQAPFAETPLGLIAMEPDGPVRRMRIAEYNQPDKLSCLLSLLRQYQSNDDANLFWAACTNGHLDIVSYLVYEGVDIELRFKGMTPLHTAVLHGHLSIFEFLLGKGADARATTTSRGLSLFHLIFWEPKPVATEKAFLEKLTDVLGNETSYFVSDHPIVTPLHLAVMNGRIGAVRILLEMGANPLALLGEDIMPSTTRGGELSAWGVKQQQARIADPAHKESEELDSEVKVPMPPIYLQGRTAAVIVLLRLDMFSLHEAISMLELLLPLEHSCRDGEKAGIEKALKSNRSFLCLLSTSLLRLKTDIWERLLEARERVGWNIGADDDGDTPLHHACVALRGASEHESSLNQAVQENSIEINHKNRYGRTPLDSRFWSFVDRDLKMEAIEVFLGRPRRKGKSKAGISTGDGDNGDRSEAVPQLTGGALESFWWELEKGMTVQSIWDARDRKAVEDVDTALSVFVRNPGTCLQPTKFNIETGKCPVNTHMTVGSGQDPYDL